MTAAQQAMPWGALSGDRLPDWETPWPMFREIERMFAYAGRFTVDVCASKDNAKCPDCKHFSRAKGGKPVEKKIRGLAWVVTRWARAVRPALIVLENVQEFADWGPLGADNRPDPTRRSLTFRRWLGQLRAAGYAVEHRALRACDYGAPTTRKRLFVVARCDGRPISWPEPTHGPGLLPYVTAASCIDWTIPCPSIFDRPKPLAEKTLRRIVRGIERFVIGSAEPFVIPVTHAGDARVHGIGEPLRTITGAHRGELALIAPALIQVGYGERPGQAPRVLDLGAPLGTVVGGGKKHALVVAFLAKHYGGHEGPGQRVDAPLSTVTAQDHHALVRVLLGASVLGGRYVIADIGMRMLQPRELFAAQGFPSDYVIDPEVDGARLSKTAQIRMCGNSVCPPLARALVEANVAGRVRKGQLELDLSGAA